MGLVHTGSRKKRCQVASAQVEFLGPSSPSVISAGIIAPFPAQRKMAGRLVVYRFQEIALRADRPDGCTIGCLSR